MCGICGFIGIDDLNLVKGMCEAIRHRGPDDSAYFIDRKISLGMKRLSIIDLKKGIYPVHNEDHSIQLVFNGEIYNYKELKNNLKNHRYYSDCDAEVIVHLYEEHGEDCVNFLRGMFALALWDSNKKRLFLAVDRLGIKPLYYTQTNDVLLFASEIKALLQYGIKRELNQNALINFLTFRYTPSTETLFNGVFKLAPGHYLSYENKNVTIKKYWDVNLTYDPKSERYYSENLLKLLKESVEMRLMSDVPLGVYLSGGLDSSAIVALMSESVDEVKTFTVGFEAQEPFNELRPAKLVADHFNTDHHPLLVKADAAALLPKAIWHLDEPVSDPTILAQYLISELTKKYVTVVLTGEGSDEVFGGYTEYKVITTGERYKNLLPGIVKANILPKLIKKMPDKILNRFFKYSSLFGEKGKQRFNEYILSETPEKSYLLLQEIFDKEEREELLDKTLNNEERFKKIEDGIKPFFQHLNRKNYLNHIINMDLKRRLPYYLLHKLDKMSMAHAIEARVPFLDHKLAEFSFTIPPYLKMRKGNEKVILKKVMKGKLPDEIIKREKQPFLVPITSWYETGLKDLAEKVFSESVVCKKYLNQEFIRKIMRDYERSKFYHGRQIWALLTFALWHKIYIENDNFSDPALSINKLFG